VSSMIARILALFVFANLFATAQVLWKQPQRATTSEWTWGPGGPETAPRAPFKFVQEKLDGTNPKVEVRDAAGRLWTVKFGSEVHADTFVPRLLNALGYAAEPTFYVARGSIAETHDLKRARRFISRDGSFRSARFKLHERRPKKDSKQAWSWANNPFVGTHELGGLKILIMLVSNWDTKDARDPEGNNEIIEPGESATPWYAVTDWGASLGKSGGFLKRDRWDWNGYGAQNASFVRMAKNGTLDWGFKGKHGQDITAGVTVDDIRWLLPHLSRITDEDMESALTASGASTAVARYYARSIRERIVQLQDVAKSPKTERAAK